ADESKRQGISFAGHVPFAVSAAEASDAGQKSIEHLTGILIGCSYKETELRNEIVKAKSPGARARAEGVELLETFSDRKAKDLFARFVKNQTWQCPTLMVIGGLTPSESLRTATLNPAKFLGLDKTLGTIESGKIADLVLLDADPLADIRNTQKINAVISKGRLFDRKALNQMLAQAETNA